MKIHTTIPAITAVLSCSFFFTISACRKSPEEPAYQGTYHLQFSAMRPFARRHMSELSHKTNGPLNVIIKKDETGTHTVTFTGCRIFLHKDPVKDSAKIIPGAHANTCLLDIGGKIGETSVAFYNGSADYDSGNTIKMTLYGTTQPVEDEGPEGTVLFYFSGSSGPGPAQHLHAPVLK